MEKKDKEQLHHENVPHAIALYRFIAQYLGIWCLTCHNVIPKFQVSSICILMVIAAISLFNELNPNCRPLNEALIPFSIGMSSTLAFIKILSIRLNHDRMLEIVKSIYENWSKIAELYNLNVIKNSTLVSKRFCLYQLISAFMSSIPMFLSGLANSNSFNATTNASEIVRILPLPNACFYQYFSSHLYFELYLFQCVQIVSIIMGNVGSDCYFFGITMHLVDQAQCLSNDIQKLEAQLDEKNTKEILRSLIERHVQLIRLAKYLEDIFTIATAFQVLANIFQVLLAGIGVLVAIRHKETTIAINGIFFVSVFMVQIFIYCYAGECLSSSINNLQTTFYYFPWYNISPKAEKDFLFIMIRCHQPFYLTAGKIMPMNLDSYKSIIKTLGSYFSVIQAMFDE